MAHGLEPEYTLVCATRTPQQLSTHVITEIGEFDPIGSISFANELNYEGEASFSIEPELVDDAIAPKLLDLKANPLELIIYRNGVWAWQGPILSSQLQGPTLTINARGIAYYMRYMGLEADVSFVTTDVFNVVRGLVDEYIFLDYGDYGIFTSDTNTYGTLVDRHYKFENRNIVFARIEELADIFDFDFWVDSNRILKLAAPRGSDKSLVFHVDEQNIINANSFWSVSADHFGSGAAAIGLKDGIPTVNAISHDTTTLQQFGRATNIATYEDVTVQVTIDNHAAETRDRIKEQIFQPGPQIGTIEGGEPTDIEPGDTISYTFKIGKLGTVSVKRRIRMMRVSLDEEGQETIELDFI